MWVFLSCESVWQLMINFLKLNCKAFQNQNFMGFHHLSSYFLFKALNHISLLDKATFTKHLIQNSYPVLVNYFFYLNEYCFSNSGWMRNQSWITLAKYSGSENKQMNYAEHAHNLSTYLKKITLSLFFTLSVAICCIWFGIIFTFV